MLGLFFDVDCEGFFEYLVVYIDCFVNYMLQCFQGVMCDIFVMLKNVYNVKLVVIVLGSGMFGMEVVV